MGIFSSHRSNVHDFLRFGDVVENAVHAQSQFPDW